MNPEDLLEVLKQTDPEDVAAVQKVVSQATGVGYQGFFREASKHSPAFAAMRSEASSRGGTATVTTRLRRCLDCDLVTNPGALGTHLAYTGHSGWEAVR